MSLGITIDGTKQKHDLNRVFKNGEGSYDYVLNSVLKWRNDFRPSTKVTFASDDLKYLKESIISLYELGIDEISANVVFENVWKENDDKIFEDELKSLADYVLDNHLYDKFKCTLFDDSIGGYYGKEDKNKTFCGAGKMLALGPDGKIYPCIRFKDYSLNKHQERTIGDINVGIDMEKVRPFVSSMIKYQSDSECLNCEVAHGCGFCQGFNYDDSETGTNFSRAKYICKMHKARVRANDYYFSKLYNRYGIERENVHHDSKKMYFILDDNYVDFCPMKKEDKNNANYIDENILKKGLEYARSNFFEPIFLHSKVNYKFKEHDFLSDYKILHIIPAEFYKESSNLKNRLFVFNENNVNLSIEKLKNSILIIDAHKLDKLIESVKILLEKSERINIFFQNLDQNFNLLDYEKKLNEIMKILVEENKKQYKLKSINILSDSHFLDTHNNCKAGDRTFAIAPNGKIYICPIFYSNGKDAIGDINDGINNSNSLHLYKSDYMPLCSHCNNYQCVNCVYLNQEKTLEVNIPPSYQCKKSSIENRVSRCYRNNDDLDQNNIDMLDILDPIELIEKETHADVGFYKK